MDDPYLADARYYDLIHAGALDDDVAFWVWLAGELGGPVVELGVGTGRIAIALAEAGIEVTGIDPSAAMLAQARTKAVEADVTVALEEGTATSVELKAEHYGLGIVPADVLLYTQSTDEQVATLEALRLAVRPGGMVAVDMPGPALWLDPASNGSPVHVFTGALDGGERLDVWHVTEDDLALQERELQVFYEVTGTDGVVRREVTAHLLRYVYRAELAMLLQLAGLSGVQVYGDYDGGPLTNESERMIATALRSE